ncbi:MAG TPA: bi-domain-containing oxidoreductase [Gemmatimonadales bacterium]
MKQVLRKGLKDIVVDDVPDPIPVPHGVIIRPSFSLISSGTETASIHREGIIQEVAHNPSHLRKVFDVMMANGPVRTASEVLAKFSDYAVLGYSGAGVVIDRHPTVTDLEIGDRVAYGGEGTGHGESIQTGRNLVARVPDDVPFDAACFATLGSIAMNGVRTGNVGLGETVAVIGLGLVGQLTAQLARLQGGRVIGVDLRPERIELAKSLGAEHGFAGGSGLADAIASVTDGKGVDCVFVAAAAKSSAPCEQALRICRDRGRIVVLGAVEMSFPWLEMYLKEIQLFMARAYGPGSYDPAYEKKGQDYPYSYVRWTENRNMEEFLRLVGSGGVQVGPLVTHRFPLEEAPSAYDTIMQPGSTSLAVLLEYPPAPEGEKGRAPVRTVPVTAAGSAPAAAAGSRVALIGAANIARWAHMPALRKAGGSVRAVQSSSGARGKAYARRFGAAYCTTDYAEVLRDEEVDIVLITSRNQYHAREALAALRAGKHVFVEKPMALTEDECAEILAAVRETGRQLTVGFNRRFAPDYVALKEQLRRRSGPAVLTARVNSPGISGSFWMADPAIGGAILGEACHFVDLFHWLLESEFEQVSAVSLPTGRAEPIGENNVAASFRFADGSIANLTYCTVGSRTSGGERVEVFAPGIGAMAEDFKRFTSAGALRKTGRRLFAEKGYDAQLRSFIDAVRSGRPAAVGAEDGARATVVCLRLMESAREGGVPLDADWRRSLTPRG